ncbi:MAG TPA: MFS transporter [Thermoplasmatales archaeon]|nr:MFS transporter [Thermoplasmatales archaeon]
MDESHMNKKEMVNGTAVSRWYLIYLVVLMGLIALMDQYLSTVKTTAIPYILKEYSITASQFSWWEALYMIPTFFIFLLNGLNDIIGRKLAILVLILLMGFSSLGITLFASSFHLFMLFYAVVVFTTVSNMWSIPVTEESPPEKRARLVTITYILGLIPLQAILPPILINTLGLDWKWIYGVMFVFMIPVIVLWFFMRETKRYQLLKEERKKGVKKHHFFGLGAINRRDVRYIVMAAAIWASWLVTGFLFMMAGHYFMDLHHYSLSRWSLVLLSTLIATMIGGLAGGWAMDKIGRGKALSMGCVGLAISLSLMGFLPENLLPFDAPVAGFFISFVYSWIIVYVPEIFPTERRGSCMGWTTTTARVSYIIGPVTAAVLLQSFPKMDWFWVAAGLIMLIPIAVIALFKPYETRVKELEEIEEKR